jgi:hydroxyacylglutathione hydrolase
MDVRSFTVGPFAENTYFIRRDGSQRALVIDPGEEAPLLLGAIDELGLDAEATGATVYCPVLETPMLADIMKWTPIPGIGPYDGYDADETLAGGEKLELAGFDVDVIFTPGHSIGHLTYSIPDETAIFSGDVLFQGSVGRVDLPGGDWPTLANSLGLLVDGHPAETVVYPGHMGITTLEREIGSNPFLADLPAAAE